MRRRVCVFIMLPFTYAEDQPLVQVVPFSLYVVGLLSFEAQVPWKPNEVLPPGGIVALYPTLVAVTELPLWLAVALHALVMCWSPGKAKARFQPLMVLLPVLAIVTLAV